MKKIAILGTGVVGQTLAMGFKKHGYDVVFGTRTVNKEMKWQDPSLASVPLYGYEEAAKWGEVIVLAVKGLVGEEVTRQVASDLTGKVVIDTMNPIADEAPQGGVLSYFTQMNSSLMERLQDIAPAARFVKAFNSVGFALMVDPQLPGGKPSMFISGNDDSAKSEVKEIVEIFGWEVEDMGGAPASRAIEALCILWCIPGFLKNDWMHAFKVLRP